MNRLNTRVVGAFIFLFLNAKPALCDIANITFCDPWFGNNFDDKTLHKIVKVKVTDESNRPVPFVEVSFFSSDSTIADFIFKHSAADSSGIAATVLQLKLTPETILNPPPELNGRSIRIRATAGIVSSEETVLNVDWCINVDPQFMGPYFTGDECSFADTSILESAFKIIEATFVPIMGPVDLTVDDYFAYSTNSRSASVISANFKGDKAAIEIFGKSRGTAHILIDGFPAAVMSVQVKKVTSILDSKNADTPQSIELYQNYPNPFNPETTIGYYLEKSTIVALKIYDISGREIETLVDGFHYAGEHIITWYAEKFTSGIYICRLQAGAFSESRKLILQK